MEPVDILLLEEGDPNSGFRTKNAPGDAARRVLVDRGEALILRATLVGVTHGDFQPDGDAATLLIFEFNFISMNQLRRFTNVQITLTFNDESENVKNRPEVFEIAPKGKFAINKATSTKDVKHSVNTSLNGNVAGVGGQLGYVWEMSQVKEKEHATTLAGVPRLFAKWGKDNGVIWNLEEDPKKKDGVPSFLRAAVLLRRKADVPFSFTIDVESGVDLGGKFRRLLGKEKPEPVDPVQLDENTDLDELGINGLDPATTDLNNMKEMDIAKHANVVLATLLNV